MVVGGARSLGHSNAILRYIARKGDPALLGKTPKEQALVDMLIDTVMDFRNRTHATLARVWAREPTWSGCACMSRESV
jgi:glutathione S-transferase